MSLSSEDLMCVSKSRSTMRNRTNQAQQQQQQQHSSSSDSAKRPSAANASKASEPKSTGTDSSCGPASASATPLDNAAKAKSNATQEQPVAIPPGKQQQQRQEPSPRPSEEAQQVLFSPVSHQPSSYTPYQRQQTTQGFASAPTPGQTPAQTPGQPSGQTPAQIQSQIQTPTPAPAPYVVPASASADPSPGPGIAPAACPSDILSPDPVPNGAKTIVPAMMEASSSSDPLSRKRGRNPITSRDLFAPALKAYNNNSSNSNINNNNAPAAAASPLGMLPRSIPAIPMMDTPGSGTEKSRSGNMELKDHKKFRRKGGAEPSAVAQPARVRQKVEFAEWKGGAAAPAAGGLAVRRPTFEQHAQDDLFGTSTTTTARAPGKRNFK
jgi:hypothetical protein